MLDKYFHPFNTTMGLFVALAGAILLSLCMGAYHVHPSQLWQVGMGKNVAGSEQISYLIFHIRLPRILLAGIAGAGLAIAGAAIQGLFRNPLADPGLIGVNSGAMLFAALAIVGIGTLLGPISQLFRHATVSLFAFLGGLGATYLVYYLSRQQGNTHVMTMLLAGIAISALAAAVTGVFIYISDDQQLRDITFWTLGSFSGASWLQVAIAAPFVLISVSLLLRHAQALNAILLGEKEAAYLGIPVEKVKSRIILLTALMVGVSIAFSGIIGFVGLVIPHFLRLLKGSDYRFLLKQSALLGSVFMILCDTFARTVIAPAELPIGILTALIGAPFFLWLLLKWKRTHLPI